MCSEENPYRATLARHSEPRVDGVRDILRPALYGALILLAAGPVFGMIQYVYLWLSTGNALHLREAIAVFATASIMGQAETLSTAALLHVADSRGDTSCSRLLARWKSPFASGVQ